MSKRNKEELVSLATELGVKDAENLTVGTLRFIVEGNEAAIAAKATEAALKKAQEDAKELEKMNSELLEHQELLDKEKKVGRPTVKEGDKVYQMPIEKMILPKGLANKVGVTIVDRKLVKEDQTVRRALLKAGSGFLIEIEEKAKK